ncbi:molybdopterin dinucleotide binding domain-containing protein, partial [Escherichia coli]|uniref:molybdopterin dinucleotide binding domain-containing protein n=1 Tax=Escherichia coli TaxID=562 RepID=UPI0026548566
ECLTLIESINVNKRTLSSSIVSNRNRRQWLDAYHIEAKVTPRMMPGVVALGEGAWYDPDAKRVDKGGCINVLTTQRPSPLAKGNPSHTNLVQVEKV